MARVLSLLLSAAVVHALRFNTPLPLTRLLPSHQVDQPPKEAAVDARAARPSDDVKFENAGARKCCGLAFPRPPQRRCIDADTLTALLAADPGEFEGELRLTRGGLPRGLSGTLYVNGPARLAMRGDRASHPLDGHGFIRAFSLQVPAAGRHARDPHTRQRATVLGRFVRTWAFELESFFGTNVFRGFFSLPFAPDSLPARLFNGFAMLRKNVANTAVVDWGGRLLALWEMGPPHALDYALKTDTKWDHCSYLDFPSSAFSRLRPLCAHTKRWIRDDGEERLVGLSVVGKSFAFYEFDETGAVASTTEHELPFATAVTHDFGLTEKYYVVAENPFRYAPDVLGGMTGGAPALGRDTIASEGRAGLVALVPRPGVDGDVILVEGFEGVAFHVANAWDTDEDTVSFAACAFDRYSMGSEYGFDPTRGCFEPATLLLHDPAWGPFLKIATIDVAAARRASADADAPRGIPGVVSIRSTGPTPRDFPRVHPKREGRSTKFAYVAASPDLLDDEPFFPFQCVQKVPLVEDDALRVLTWRPSRPGCFVGEPVFAPREGGAAEDDGWLLVLVHDVPSRATDLAVLDAHSLTLVAELRVDRLLPLGLHGAWSPA